MDVKNARRLGILWNAHGLRWQPAEGHGNPLGSLDGHCGQYNATSECNKVMNNG
jgi:hypothetical protein